MEEKLFDALLWFKKNYVTLMYLRRKEENLVYIQNGFINIKQLLHRFVGNSDYKLSCYFNFKSSLVELTFYLGSISENVIFIVKKWPKFDLQPQLCQHFATTTVASQTLGFLPAFSSGTSGHLYIYLYIYYFPTD